jgi:hypothetical protein
MALGEHFIRVHEHFSYNLSDRELTNLVMKNASPFHHNTHNKAIQILECCYIQDK